MRFTAPQLLNKAKMTHTPFVILEGKDDISIYTRIIDEFLTGKKIKFYVINQIDGCEDGCYEIIKCIDQLRVDGHFANDPENLHRVLGIIDRDVRPFRALGTTEIDYRPLVGNGLFILKYYSIETYFATQNLIAELIGLLTYYPKTEIPTTIINLVESLHIANVTSELFHLSLESLKKACDDTYQDSNTVSYGVDIIRDRNQRAHLISMLSSKIADLDTFASSLSLSTTDIKLICKGKWYLQTYIFDACQKIAALENLCHTKAISECPSCIAGVQKDCYYKKRQDRIPDYDQLANSAQVSLKMNSSDFSDIIAVLSDLKA